MVYINIPYVPENDRIDRSLTAKELKILDIGEEAKYQAFEAIYHKHPRGVNFESMEKAVLLQGALARLGVPYRQSTESDYKYEVLR